MFEGWNNQFCNQQCDGEIPVRKYRRYDRLHRHHHEPNPSRVVLRQRWDELLYRVVPVRRFLLALALLCGTAHASYTPQHILCGGSGSVANGAGATDFLGIANLSTTEAAVEFPMSTSGTMTGLYVSSATAAGSSKTFTYTVDKTTVAQSMTCNFTGTSATTCSDTAHPFAFVASNLIDVKLVTTASSNTGAQSFCLSYTVP